MSDACCGHDAPGVGDPPEAERVWDVSELRAAAVAGVLLAGALVSWWVDAPRWVVLALQASALLAGASTFVPSTLKRLVQGKIGVGTLMTIAAVGAVLLGQLGGAAMLAFLFAISEGLEEYSFARARRGLRALLSLVPDEATVLRDGDGNDLLLQNYPNPFNPTTRIDFRLPKQAHVKLDVFNVLGQQVATLVDGQLTAGTHSATFDASQHASGLYFYRLKADNEISEVRKMMLLK